MKPIKFLLLIISICIFNKSYASDDEIKSIAQVFRPFEITTNFNSVIGAQEAKEELQDVVDFLKNYRKYQDFGVKFPRGILLVGEPGNGKTLLAKALAGEAHCYFFSVSGSDFIQVFVGVGASRVRDLFDHARRYAPSIIFIDEIDSIGGQRGSSSLDTNSERLQTLNQLLTEMDGFESYDAAPVIVIAATNTPDMLDNALLRRFDQKIEVPYPTTQDREQILKLHAKKMSLSSDVNFKKIAIETAGFSGSSLAQLINKAARIALKMGHRKITMQDLELAHKKMLRSFKDQGSKDHITMLVPTQVQCNFEQVAGMQEAKEELQDIVDFLKNPEKFKKLGAKITHGVLLSGEPGNGKTLLAKAVAGEANCPFFSISASEFVEKFVGVGASRVRELFKQARKHNPSIIFIDEIDAIGTDRDSYEGSSERNQTLNQLLTEMDGFNSDDSSVIVIAATNRPEALDAALLRAGRFDRKVEVPYPDLYSREKILQLHVKSIIMDPKVDLHKIALNTVGYSGAELANLVNEAALDAAHNNQAKVTMQNFEEACDKIVLGKKSQTKTFTQHELKVTAYHESGHALVRLLLPELTDPLHKITIAPRGHALGVTFSLPEREKYSYTKEEMLATIMVCLGGRAAEELAFNIIGTGASSDFEKATSIAWRMICYYGMSEALGLMIYKQRSGDYSYSEKTAELIDQEIKALLSECYKKTKTLLTNNRDKLDKLALKLLEKETLYADDVYTLLGIKPRVIINQNKKL